jgi:hypothetical protein
MKFIWKKILITLPVLLIGIQLFSQENIALGAKIIASKNIKNADYLIDGQPTFVKECEFNFSNLTIDLGSIYPVDSIVLILGKDKGCDNWIKNITIQSATTLEDFFLLKAFGEGHFVESLSCNCNKEVRYLKFDLHVLEDCMENEHLCIEEIQVFSK